jgi:20S proteasome subunit alpha 3
MVAGISADANILIDHARLVCQRYEFAYGGQPIPVEQLVRQLCDLKQSYTQNGGMRPFGVAFLIAGWDRIHGLQLYQSDPSGNYSGWCATCIGAGASAAQSILKAEYPESDRIASLTTANAGKLLVKVLEKTMEAKILNGEKGIFQRFIFLPSFHHISFGV